MRPEARVRRGATARFVLGLAVVAVWLEGCATWENGTLDEISVVTIPAGASVSASSGAICTSPCLVSGSRKEDIGITISKDGYVTQYVVSASKPGAALAAAQTPALTSDAVGRFVDIQDGAYLKHVPASFVITLDRSP